MTFRAFHWIILITNRIEFFTAMVVEQVHVVRNCESCLKMSFMHQ